MRHVLVDVTAGDAAAVLALDVYIHRLRAGIAAMAAALGGLDVLVFTGGIGERAPVIRERACAGLAFLGVAVDKAANRQASGDAEISAPGSAARTFVVRAREDAEMARQARAALAGGGGAAGCTSPV